MSTENISPTRINLIRTKKTLSLAESGRDVLERKRDILLRELRNSIFEAEKAREELLENLTKAYQSLKEANMAEGSETVANVALGSSYEANFLVDFKSIMGVSVPNVEFQSETDAKPEGTTFQIASDVGRTQRRVNALNYVLIPMYRDITKTIALVLEEKDREEFVRTKRIKHM